MKQLTKQLTKKYQGVTLTELIVTISIIGILTAVTVPTVSHYLPGIQLNGSARVLSSSLREAQEKTITEQKQYMIEFYPAASPASYKLIRVDNSEEQKTVKLASGQSLSAMNTNDPPGPITQIVFSIDGGATPNGKITLTINGVDKIVSVSPAGFIKIE